MRRNSLTPAFFIFLSLAVFKACQIRAGEVPRFHVCEIVFHGPQAGPKDTPARQVRLAVTFLHEKSGKRIKVYGFWDGDGAGAAEGNCFVVRFCPTETGRWRIVRTESNKPELRGKREGELITCVPSGHDGFWIAEGRWYRRTSGRRPYIIGNTHYSFLSLQTASGLRPNGSPVEDILGNAKYYRKLRFSLFGDRYPDPKVKPFLDDYGRPTDAGRFSFRPNPTWFRKRVDPVVEAGFRVDLICDLILCGPDTFESRSALKGDPEPFLRYIAARYGSYPNVWFCLCNEWNIKSPSYSAEEIRRAGEILRRALPYSNPISVHGSSGDWNMQLNGAWHDHVTIQAKIKRLDRAADIARRNFRIGRRKPVVNDENAYEGAGDRFSEADVIEGCFGTFMGGGYPTTGEKYGRKLGQYFWGCFDPRKHGASDNLRYLRDFIEKQIVFRKLKPLSLEHSPIRDAPSSSRLLAEKDRQYVLGTNRYAERIEIKLGAGAWRVLQIDLIGKKKKVLSEGVRGTFTFSTPDSRAVLTYFKRISAR